MSIIRHIYTLKPEFLEKEIYIWDVSQKAIITFTFLAFRGINISGFVTDVPEYYGQTLLNRPVLSLEQLKENNQAILICDSFEKEETLAYLRPYGTVIGLEETFGLNPELLKKEHYLYGLGHNAWEMVKDFSNNGIRLKGFLQTKNEVDALCEKPVFQFDQVDLSEEESIIISTRVINAIIDLIEQRGFKGDLYIKEFVNYADLWMVDPFQLIDRAMKDGKRILLCCDDERSRELFHYIFEMYQIPISREVCQKGDPDLNLGDIYDLADEDPENSLLLIHDFIGSRRCELVDAAYDMGYSLEDKNIAGFYQIQYNHNRWNKVIEYEADLLMGYNMDYSALGGIPGWAVYGKDHENAIRIAIVGGSTSSEVYYPENWVSKLYKKMTSSGYELIIYNGAHEANDVENEMRRLVRDIHFLHPDLVLSMSGINDINRKQDKFEMLRDENTFSYWRRMEYYMKAVSEAENAGFFAFLQPINRYPDNCSMEHKLLFSADTNSQSMSPWKAAKDDDFYVNLMNLFPSTEGIYIDMLHYSEEANEKIAEKVFEVIQPKCEELLLEKQKKL